MKESTMIAVCGLDCGSCSIRTAPFDADAAQELVIWFREQGWLEQDEGVSELLARGPYCEGCHGSRQVHWSADCWILQCCVDEKGLTHCSECEVFPCPRLVEWAKQNDGYAAALERLREMREAGPTP